MEDEILAGLTVKVLAEYVNHDEWSSPIEVEDDETWLTTQGTSVLASLTDNNDGTISASLNIDHAADYTLSILVDNTNVINSPHTFLKIEPGAPHVPNFVPVEVPEEMNAGFRY